MRVRCACENADTIIYNNYLIFTIFGRRESREVQKPVAAAMIRFSANITTVFRFRHFLFEGFPLSLSRKETT